MRNYLRRFIYRAGSLLGKELFPLGVVAHIIGGDIETSGPGHNRLAQQSHAGFGGCSASLMVIAGYTGTNYILPGMFTALVSGDDMVQGQVVGFLATILAHKPVPEENLKPS